MYMYECMINTTQLQKSNRPLVPEWPLFNQDHPGPAVTGYRMIRCERAGHRGSWLYWYLVH